VELLVAMGAVVLIGIILLTLTSTALRMWAASERQARVYARARAVFAWLDEDLEAALTRDPPGAPVVNRLVCDLDSRGRQVLMLTRTFGGGAERGMAFDAGDGLDTVEWPALAGKPRADDEDADPRTGRADEEIYNFKDDDGDGRVDEDLAPLGGTAQVVYLHRGRELLRALRAPVGPDFASMYASAQPLARDVLYFGLLFATPYTTSRFGADRALTATWDESVPKLPGPKYTGARGYGPERIWDSTRGLLPGFSFHAGPESRDDGEDDVFPELVRVTLVVEPDEMRTVRTDLLATVSDTAGRIPVASTRGFPDAGGPDSYILVDDEWMYCSGRDEASRSFTVTRRGQRGTVAAVHAQGAQVRCGMTFTRTFYLPGHRSEEAVTGVSRR
jgi:hypothetical protein